VLFFQRFHIACRLRMISSGNDQLCIRHGSSHNLECLNHELEALVGSPFTERQNAVVRIATLREIRIFGSAGQNTMRSDVNIVVAVLFVKNLPVPGHEHRDGVREEDHSGGNSAGSAVKTRVLHACILQIDSIHQMMQSDVGIAAA